MAGDVIRFVCWGWCCGSACRVYGCNIVKCVFGKRNKISKSMIINILQGGAELRFAPLNFF